MIESCHRYWLCGHPVCHRVLVFLGFALELAHADDFIFVGNFVREVVKRTLAKAVQVGIPRGPRGNVEAAFARLLEDFVPFVLHGDGIFLVRVAWGSIA